MHESYAMEKNELPVGYYLENFQRLLDHATELYSDILTEQERDWIENFDKLTTAAKRLLVRLYTRKGEWFRSDKLIYQEIPSTLDALGELEARGFVSLNCEISEQQLAQLLMTKAEVLKAHPNLPKTAKKEALVALLPTESKQQQLEFVLVKLHAPAHLETLLLLFFANSHQNQSQFILEDLGLHRFENYILSEELRFFNSRQQVETLRLLSSINQHYHDSFRYLTKAQKKQQLDDWLEQINADNADSALHHYSNARRQMTLNTIARDYERLGEIEVALELFQQTQLPPSRERQARMHLQLEKPNQALELVESMLAKPLSLEEAEVAQRVKDKCIRALGDKVPRKPKPLVDEDRLTLDLSTQRVELAAAEHYQQQGYEVYFVENAFVCGLFGLLFWDAIFAPVEGAFINAYQMQPKNLYSSKFCELRATYLEQCRARFEQQGYQVLLDTYDAKQGTLNPFVHWQRFSKELLLHAKASLPKSILLALCDILLEDRKAYRAGMPDLIAFKQGELQWIEVKGPGDKLQHNQWRWIKHFQRLKLPIKVCYVNH